MCVCVAGERVFSTEVGGNETQVTLRGLSPNQMYRVRMTAGTRAGFGPVSEWHTHHTPDLLNLTMGKRTDTHTHHTHTHTHTLWEDLTCILQKGVNKLHINMQWGLHTY